MARLKVYARKVFTVCVTIPLCAIAMVFLGIALAAMQVSDE